MDALTPSICAWKNPCGGEGDISTCVPEVSAPTPRSAPTRRSTSNHYSNLASPYRIHALNLLRSQPGKKEPCPTFLSYHSLSINLLSRSIRGRSSASPQTYPGIVPDCGRTSLCIWSRRSNMPARRAWCARRRWPCLCPCRTLDLLPLFEHQTN